MPEARAALPLAPLLTARARRGQVLGVFPRAVYIAVGHAVAALVAEGGLGLPIALILRGPFSGLFPGMPAAVGDGVVTVGGLRVTAGEWWDPRPRVGPLVPLALAEARAALAGSPSAVAEHLPLLAAPLLRGDLAATEKAANRLVGLGPGLTPAGDDVLAGTLAALRLFGGMPLTIRAAGRTTSLSAALLACAARGEVLEEAAVLLRALGGDGPVHPAAAALLRVGHSSGRDLAAGIVLGATAAGR